jgi:hypothetical protein
VTETRFSRAPRHRFLLTLYVALSLLAVQALKIHFHTVEDHGAHHAHGHVMELHAGALSTDSDHDHDATGEETAAARFAILKNKTAPGDGLDLPLAAAPLLFFGLVAPRRSRRRTPVSRPPGHGNDAITPPLRAPPR